MDERIQKYEEKMKKTLGRGLLPPTLYISNPMYEKKERPHAGIR